jgi:dephospho-CoA kinase
MEEHKMKIIGLTGGIGSGKSTVSDYLMKRGFPVLDADRIAREIVLPGSEMLIQLKSVFGEEIIQDDGGLNRKRLGRSSFPMRKKEAAGSADAYENSGADPREDP